MKKLRQLPQKFWGWIGNTASENQIHIICTKSVQFTGLEAFRCGDLVSQERLCVCVCVCVCVCAYVQSCLTLWDPMDCSPPGSSVHWIFQARIFKWVAILPPVDFPDPGIKPMSPVSPSGGSFTTRPPGNPRQG